MNTMDELSSKLSTLNRYAAFYKSSSNDLPRRHFHNKFIKDYKQWTSKYFDFVHYSLPLQGASSDGYRFPGEYVG